MRDVSNRRHLLALGAGALVLGCRRKEKTSEPRLFSGEAPTRPPADVTATEDLMREHGVLRRILVLYREVALRIRTKSGSVPLDALTGAARLMRSFGEDYHEVRLEEARVFPLVKRSASPSAAEIDVLVDQHHRAREITDYLLSLTHAQASLGEPLALALDSFARMYEEHAAREDTIVFPAWKAALSPRQREDEAAAFEDIEHRTFGHDGFEDGLRQIAAFELAIGLDPAKLTAPPPPPETAPPP